MIEPSMQTLLVVGEDEVSRAIIAKLLAHTGKSQFVLQKEPIRGSQLKALIPKYNRLGAPAIILVDLDSGCPPNLIRDWFGNNPIHNNLLFRIACDESESWLMSDREGFAAFMDIRSDLLPRPVCKNNRNPLDIELDFSFKPSLFLMKQLASKSPNEELRRKLTPLPYAKKGPEYNSALIPFIHDKWNVEAATLNSYSLLKAVQRIRDFVPNFH